RDRLQSPLELSIGLALAQRALRRDLLHRHAVDVPVGQDRVGASHLGNAAVVLLRPEGLDAVEEGTPQTLGARYAGEPGRRVERNGKRVILEVGRVVQVRQRVPGQSDQLGRWRREGWRHRQDQVGWVQTAKYGRVVTKTGARRIASLLQCP